MVGVLHESWQEAAGELDQCRLSQRRAQEDARKAEAEARRRERRYHGAGGASHRGWHDDEYYPTESDDDEDDGDGFDFYGPFSGGESFLPFRCWR